VAPAIGVIRLPGLKRRLYVDTSVRVHVRLSNGQLWESASIDCCSHYAAECAGGWPSDTGHEKFGLTRTALAESLSRNLTEGKTTSHSTYRQSVRWN
jgi:hypothetical protein